MSSDLIMFLHLIAKFQQPDVFRRCIQTLTKDSVQLPLDEFTFYYGSKFIIDALKNTLTHSALRNLKRTLMPTSVRHMSLTTTYLQLAKRVFGGENFSHSDISQCNDLFGSVHDVTVIIDCSCKQLEFAYFVATLASTHVCYCTNKIQWMEASRPPCCINYDAKFNSIANFDWTRSFPKKSRIIVITDANIITPDIAPVIWNMSDNKSFPLQIYNDAKHPYICLNGTSDQALFAFRYTLTMMQSMMMQSMIQSMYVRYDTIRTPNLAECQI